MMFVVPLSGGLPEPPEGGTTNDPEDSMARLRIRPPADLKPRDDDEELSVAQLKQIGLFKDVNLERLELEGFPGTLVLRRFRKGEVICRQNHPGYTAFFILTIKDLVELRQSQLAAASGDALQAKRLEAEIAALKESASASQPAASVVRESGARGQGQPDKATPRTTMHEGELFGEMSCLYRMPRTATVVAERDCYMLELLRNILDKMYGNKKFKEQVDTAYRKRLLGFDLRSLPLFQELDAKLLEALRDRAELEEFEPGDLICDEHERAESMYIIRSGFVKVMKDATALLSESSVSDWASLCKALHAGGQEAAGPRRKLWDLLSGVQSIITKTTTSEALTDSEKKQLLFALNERIKQPKLYTQIDGKLLAEAAPLESQAKKLSGSPAKWSQHQDIRQFNRRLLMVLYPGPLPAQNPGTPRILAYRSANDPLIGEIGLILDEPRSATCIAYDHYGEGKLINGRVELVRISRELFDEIRNSSPQMQERVRHGVEERLRYTEQRLSVPVWQEATPAALSARFNDLGLIQGQKLMLIDLDRCTRCDKCVEACVTTHSGPWWGGLPILKNFVTGPTDGRSRLFLEGPRFQVVVEGEVKNYLVPSTCRMCRDPVCLVGCPVGSIHKGENGQIVIEDWCIGCSRCANQCPYGSIQMHAVGVIPRGIGGWRSRRGKGAWHAEKTPIANTRDFRDRYAGDGVVRFRYRFTPSREILEQSKSFQLHLQTAAADPRVRLNGRKVVLIAVKGSNPGGMKWTHEAMLTREGAAPVQGLAPGESAPQPLLKPGRNVVTVRIKPSAAEDEVLCDLGLYAVLEPVVSPGVAGEFNQEVVMNTAVVCDLCSSQLGQRPACVNACPHEAALRVDATSFFPLK